MEVRYKLLGKFCIGDRVLCVVDSPSDNDDIKIGTEGTVVQYSDKYNPPVGVFWDQIIPDGHTCDNACPVGHGWFVEEHEVELCSSKDLRYDETSDLEDFLKSLT